MLPYLDIWMIERSISHSVSLPEKNILVYHTKISVAALVFLGMRLDARGVFHEFCEFIADYGVTFRNIQLKFVWCFFFKCT